MAIERVAQVGEPLVRAARSGARTERALEDTRERREHLRHRLGAVLRNHADRVARQIGHALFQRQRKMPRLLLGPLAAEKAIDQHGRMVWIVARVPGTPIHIRGGLIGWRPRLWNFIHASIVTGTRGFLC